MNRIFLRICLILLLGLGWSVAALADYKADIGYSALREELGSALLTGAGVKVTQVEAASGMPDVKNLEFTGKTFNAKSSSLATAAHATQVGTFFYGNSGSVAPGITAIDCYDAADWLGWGFLSSLTYTPLASSSRVANHSWVAGATGSFAVKVLSRLDWVIGRDEYINVVAMNNGGTSNVALLGSSFNAIAVGLSNGAAARNAYPLTTTPATPYASGSRTRPDLVAPASATSYATPLVSAAAALLVEEGHQGGARLSTDPAVISTTRRPATLASGLPDSSDTNLTIYNAERSEVVKAALMAGASRTSANLTNSVTPQGYQVNTANGLNHIYGAGELNIYNSYRVIAAGEQNSREDDLPGNGEIKATGFDYDPCFGGAQGSNRMASYVFSTLSAGTMSASLVWNLNVAGETVNGFSTSATLYHLGLYLYDLTAGNLLVASSDSSVDNTQNFWTSLDNGQIYQLVVKADLGQADFLWDYGLAWDISAATTHAPLPATFWFMISGLIMIIVLRRRKLLVHRQARP